jgi:hypothetical protein
LGKLTAKGTAWPSAPGEQTKPNFVEPINGFLKFMDEFGVPDPRLKRAAVSFRQSCARPPESGFSFRQQATDGCSADLQPAGDFRFADSLPV